MRGYGLVFCLIGLGVIAVPPLAAAQPGPITATTGWFRYLLPQIPAGGFVTLHNSSARAIVLDGAQTTACGMAMLHKSVNRSGVDRMVMVNSVTIPAHGSFRFSPGGYHIMCMQPTMKPGETVTVSLSFQNAPDLDVPFKVYGADGKPGAK
ncbi:MAG: copper chaperone PCu(A)C [Acidiphilium sp.]|nr:copper chaperone PCu(A)C [Acidiphilium sp.]MDD4934794.1 copper chaperone PCu(A)C [Acidiphilium sp.]